jgi:hypothetical protein
MSKEKTEYIFRGTSRDFAGGSRAKEIPATCTTRNPAKAVLFAIVALPYSFDAGIYYTKVSNLKEVEELNPNVLSREEEERVFKILPKEYIKLCEGFIKLSEAQEALSEQNINTRIPVRLDSLTRECHEMKKMTTREIKKFIELITK